MYFVNILMFKFSTISKAMCVSLLERGKEELGTELNKLQRPKRREKQDFRRREASFV